jgi:hypothetical protein
MDLVLLAYEERHHTPFFNRGAHKFGQCIFRKFALALGLCRREKVCCRCGAASFGISSQNSRYQRKHAHRNIAAFMTALSPEAA